ncbi:MAG: GNAT family N-acetyltransferase [Azospirillaceae bacterium]|nr:GNAT family N-acetyltransferase [Azospirillaceae bacterium]
MTGVRQAELRDAAGIAKVHVASWRTTYPGLIPDAYLLSLEPRAYEERWRRMLSQPRIARGSFVALDPDQDVVGFATCGPVRQTGLTTLADYAGEFYAIYLFDYVQSQGFGRQLMAAMAAALCQTGSGSAVVWVLADNPARWFYERLGGVRIAERPIVFAGSSLIEFAYGWRDLMPLARLSADPKVR